MQEIFIGIIYGMIGAFIQVLVTTYRHIFHYKEKINLKSYFVFIAGTLTIGAFMGIVLSYRAILAAIGGYAGSDLAETVGNAFKKKKFVVK